MLVRTVSAKDSLDICIWFAVSPKFLVLFFSVVLAPLFLYLFLFSHLSLMSFQCLSFIFYLILYGISINKYLFSQVDMRSGHGPAQELCLSNLRKDNNCIFCKLFLLCSITAWRCWTKYSAKKPYRKFDINILRKRLARP